jgi:hypothetical protein
MKVLWRVAAGLCIAHIVLMLAGYSQQHAPMPNASPAQVVAAYQTGAETKTYVGEYIAVVAFLVLLAAVAALGTLLRSERPAAQWLSRFVGGSGITYVAVTIGISFAPAATAFYLARHGGDTALVGALDKLAMFGTAASIAAMGLFTIAIGAAALASGALGRFIGWSGIAVGLWVLASVAGIGRGLIDYGQLVWMIWFVVLAGAMLRRAGRATPAPEVAEAAARPLVASAS